MKKLYTILISMLLCGWVQAQIDSVQQIPATVPYGCDFNNPGENARWILTRSGSVYSTYLNHFAIGTGTSVAGGADQSLYISNDTTALEAYGAYMEASHYFAERIIDFGSVPQTYVLELDWKASGGRNGTNIYAGLKVFLRDTADLLPQDEPVYSADHIEIAVGDTGWRHIRVPLDDVSGLKTLQFYTWGYINASARVVPAAIDNITVTPATCDAPQFTVTVEGAHAVFNWQGAPTDTFLLVYRPASESAQSNVYKTVTGSTDTVGGLLSNTEYIAWMAKLCGDDTSAMYMGTHFTTGCGTYPAPFEEHFSDPQHCWTLPPQFTFSSFSGYIQTGNYHSSTGYADTVMAVSPVIDVSHLDHPYLKFSRRQSEYNGEHKDLALYYREDEEDEWHYMGTFVTPTFSNGWYNWKEDSLAIPSYSATLQLGFFSIQHEDQQLATISLDNIYVYDGPGCEVVSDVAFAGQSGDTAYIHWVGASGADRIVRYRPAGEPFWFNTNDLGGYAAIEPLASLTQYEVEVATDCDSLVWIPCTFTSQVLAVGLPYSTDFAETSDRAWELDNGTCLNHWAIGSPLLQDGTAPASNALFVTNNDTTACYGNDNFYTTVVASKRFLMSDISTVHIEFDVLCGGNTQNNVPNDYLKVFFAPVSESYTSSEDNLAYASATATAYAMNFHDYLCQTGSSFYDYKLNLTQDSILHISAEMPNPALNGEAKLVFVWRNDYSTNGDVQPAAVITNVQVWQPDCDVVYGLSVQDVVGDEATVNWTVTTTDSLFTVQYKPQGDDWSDSSVVTMTVNETSAHLTGLNINTLYDLRVRINCGSEGGDWRSMTFTSACLIFVTDSTPYEEPFADPQCWTFPLTQQHGWEAVNGVLRHVTHADTAGNACLVFSPLMDISAVSHPYFKFSRHMPTDNFGGTGIANMVDTLRVLYRTGYQDEWHTLFTYTTSTLNYEWDSLPLPDTLSLLQIGFMVNVNHGRNISVDNFTVYDGPSCAAISNLTVVDVAADAVTLSWTGFNDFGYLIRYHAIDDTAWVYSSTTGSSYVINGLQDSHLYWIEVSGDCAEPNWMPVSVTTLLSAATLPYFTNFSPGSDFGWKLNNSSCTNYWMIGEVDTVNHTGALFVTQNGSTPGYDTTARLLVTAEKLFEVGDADSILVEFDLRIGGEGRNDFLKLFLVPETSEYPAVVNAEYYSPNYGQYNFSTNAFNFTSYAPYTNNSWLNYFISETSGNGFVHITALMKNPVATNPSLTRAKVVFLWKNDHSWGVQPGAIITNIYVSDTFSVCYPVTQLTVSDIHADSAHISWTPIGGETDWVLEWQESSSAAWTAVNVTGTPAHTLTGLTPNRSYNVRVKADCGGNAQSPYTNISFETPLCDFSCPYMFVLSDSYGDGWSGGVLSVFADGVLIADLQAENHHLSQVATSDTVWVDLCHDVFVELSWDGGGFTDECGVTLTGPDGTQLYQQIGYPFVVGDSTVFTFTSDCPYTLPVVVTDSASGITQTEAVLHGHIADPGDLPILARGFELYGGGYTAVSASGNSMAAPVSGLSPSTTYLYHAFAITPLDTVYGNDMVFTTLDEEIPPCPAPTDLHVIDSADYSIAVAWTETGDAEQWRVLYRASSGQMSSDIAYAPSYLITGLQPGTEYQIQVQSVCGLQSSDWTPAVTASTTTGLHDFDRYVRVYPNPAGDVINVECTLNNVQLSGKIEVVDVYGKVIDAVVETRHGTSLPIRINVSDLAAGMYFVRVATEAGMVTKAFVKK